MCMMPLRVRRSLHCGSVFTRASMHEHLASVEDDVRLPRRELEQALLEKALALSLEQHSAPEVSAATALTKSGSLQPNPSEEMDRCARRLCASGLRSVCSRHRLPPWLGRPTFCP